MIGFLARIAIFCVGIWLALAARAQDQVDSRTLTHQDQRIEVAVIGVPDSARAQLLHDWVAEVVDASRTASGRFALPRARIEVRQLQSKSPSAVPWGQTDRTDTMVKVLLYVRASASKAELYTDWTATHEMAHLYHPYLGQSGRWLAEGFASYQQYRYMARAGMISAEQAWQDFDAGLQRGAASVPANSKTPMTQARGTMRVYWAGAAFWLAVDMQLRAGRGGEIQSLDELMDRYVQCCVVADSGGLTPAQFVSRLDALLGNKPILKPIYQRYAQSTAFPDLSDSYPALGLYRDGASLHMRNDPGARRLRNAVMLSATPKH